MTDVDDILGPRCPECGHRPEHLGHRPKIGEYLEACSQWTPRTAPQADPAPIPEPRPAP